MKKWNGLLIFIVWFLLSACAPQRIAAEAESYKTHSEANQASLDAQQKRAQQARLDEMIVQDEVRKQLVKDAGLANAQRAAGWVMYWGGIAVTLATVSIVLSIGAGGSFAIVGSGRALARAAHVKANLIQLDRVTGQYPLVLEYAGKGIVSLTDPNTNSTLLLDTRNEPDRMMIQTAGAIRHVGVLAAAAQKSKDPTGVSMIRPMIIDNVEAQ